MFDRTHFIDLIENAERDQPACPQCAAILVAAVHEGALWLECPTLGEPRPFLRQLIRLDFEATHGRRLLLSASETLAA